MAVTQVSSILSTPKIFQTKSVKTPKVSPVTGPLYRPVARPHTFAFNPALDTTDLAPSRAFVRPDCPPDASEQAPNGLNGQAKLSAPRLTNKHVRNGARSALEQVSFFTNNKLQEEKRQASGFLGIFGL